MRARDQSLTEHGPSDGVADELLLADPACDITVHSVLDILEAILKERSRGGAAPLRFEDVQEVIAQVRQAPDHLQKLYEDAGTRSRGSTVEPQGQAPAAAGATPSQPAPVQIPAKRGVGRLQTIGLQAVRAELGDRWEAVAERVRSTSLAVIKRTLASSDSFLCNEKGDFIICFGELNDEAAWLKAKAIEQEIRERLIGTTGDSTLEDFELTFETLSEIADLQSETHDLELPPISFGEENEVSALVAAKFEEASRAIRARVRDHLRQAEEIWTLDLREVQVASGAPARLVIAEANNQTRMALERLKGAARRDATLMANIDLLALGAAAEVLASGTVSGGALLAIEIHASTVMKKATYELFRATCQKTTKEVRDRLVLVVGDLPRDVYAPTLTDTLRLLKGFSRVTALRLSTPQLGGLDLKAAGVPLVILTQSTASAALRRTPKAFARFLHEVHAAGGRLLVDQVVQEDAVEALTAAGIELWSKAGA